MKRHSSQTQRLCDDRNGCGRHCRVVVLDGAAAALLGSVMAARKRTATNVGNDGGARNYV